MDSLRPMSASEILDRTFSLYRNNFLLFAGIAVLPAAMELILRLAGAAAHITANASGRGSARGQLESIGFQLIVSLASTVVGGGIATGATIYGVYCAQLNQSVSIRSSYRYVLERWLQVIWTAILVFLTTFALSALGTIAILFVVVIPLSLIRGEAGILAQAISVLILAAFWLYVEAHYALVLPPQLLERISAGEAFRRNVFLGVGATGRIFLVLMLAGIFGYAVSWILQLPGTALASGGDPLLTRLWSDVAHFLSSTLAAPISTIAVALIYIDQRIRKEAFDLQIMMDAIEQAPAEPQALAQSAD